MKDQFLYETEEVEFEGKTYLRSVGTWYDADLPFEEKEYEEYIEGVVPEFFKNIGPVSCLC